MGYPTAVDRPSPRIEGGVSREEKGIRLDKLDHESLVLWAADCAEHVLPYFEEEYPEDDRPRNAVEVGRAWARGEIATGEARAAASAAHAAARAAGRGAARAAARAAGHAAPTVHVAGHAAHAANYAVTAARAAAVPTEGPPPPKNVIGSPDASRSTSGRWRSPPGATTEQT